MQKSWKNTDTVLPIHLLDKHPLRCVFSRFWHFTKRNMHRPATGELLKNKFIQTCLNLSTVAGWPHFLLVWHFFGCFDLTFFGIFLKNQQYSVFAVLRMSCFSELPGTVHLSTGDVQHDAYFGQLFKVSTSMELAFFAFFVCFSLFSHCNL